MNTTYNYDAVFSTIQEVLAKLKGIDDLILKPSTRLIEELGMDSLDIIEFVTRIEDIYAVDFSQQDMILANLGSIDKITNALLEIVASK